MWLLSSKTRITLAVAAVAAFELFMLFANGRPGLAHLEATTPYAAIVVGPFLIALAVFVQIWARRDARTKLIENAAYGMMLIWLMSYGFALFVALHRSR
jgi:TRAP-type C4-dicarboxylate transport system permease small subunit